MWYPGYSETLITYHMIMNKISAKYFLKLKDKFASKSPMLINTMEVTLFDSTLYDFYILMVEFTNLSKL